MEKNFMKSDSLIELEFLSGGEMTETHFHENFELVFLLNGHLTVTVEEESFILRPRDMLVINAGRHHNFESTPDTFIGRFMISYSKTRDLLGQNMIMFWCNSVVDKNEAYDELRDLITRIFNQYQKNDPRGNIYLKSLYYQLLHILTSNFLLTSNDLRYEVEKSKTDERMQEILQYIRSNYKQDISLSTLSEQLYLSTAYLSKYIKRKSNVSFVEMVNSVRLDHAVEDILYSSSSIMKIAMDNGFASVAAFNKCFKEKYNQTPSEFRKKMKRQKSEEEEQQEAQRQELIAKKVEEYLEESQNTLKEHKKRNYIECTLDMKKSVLKKWNNCGCKLINVGTALDITKTSYQNQILFLKEKTGAVYVRFWDIYSPEMYLDIHAAKEQMHFGKLYEVLDFLVKNHLKPYIELGFKPLRLLRTTQNALKEVRWGQEFGSDEEMEIFYKEFISHILQRYGEKEVSGWYFEYWKKEDIAFEKLNEFTYKPLAVESHERYLHEFDIIAGRFRRYLPHVKIGGGGFALQHYGKDGIMQILKGWKSHKELPSFISLNCYPYQIQRDGHQYYEKKSTDISFVLHNLEIIRECLEQTEFPEVELHVSEFSFSLSNRNVVNDSCVKAAFLMQTQFECCDRTNFLGHWLATDSYADYSDSQSVLFGGCGLLTKQGITKPSFYTYEFLHNLYDTMLYKEKNYIVTGNKRGSFRIAAHNFKKMNYNYYLADEDKIKISDIPFIMDDRENLELIFTFHNVENGNYSIKYNQVNSEFGSVQDEWLRLDMERDLSVREQSYLEKVSTPRLSSRRVTVSDHVLTFKTVLKPNEIQYLHVAYRDL